MESGIVLLLLVFWRLTMLELGLYIVTIVDVDIAKIVDAVDCVLGLFRPTIVIVDVLGKTI